MIANGVIGGKKLPALANPAGAAQILSGYQSVGSTGELIEGAVPVLASQTITPGAAAKTIAAGKYWNWRPIHDRHSIYPRWVKHEL